MLRSILLWALSCAIIVLALMLLAGGSPAALAKGDGGPQVAGRASALFASALLVVVVAWGVLRRLGPPPRGAPPVDRHGPSAQRAV